MLFRSEYSVMIIRPISWLTNNVLCAGTEGSRGVWDAQVMGSTEYTVCILYVSIFFGSGSVYCVYESVYMIIVLCLSWLLSVLLFA